MVVTIIIIIIVHSPMKDGSTGQHHRVVIGRLRRITPCLPSVIPDVISNRKSNNPLREIPPHTHCKVNLNAHAQNLATTSLIHEIHMHNFFNSWCRTFISLCNQPPRST